MKNETAKHTPGPWRWAGNDIITHHQYRPATICEVWPKHASTDWGVEKEEAQANARLIAAAPELLAALKKACAWIAHGEEGEDEDTAWIKQHPDVAAAIAKAEGR